MLVCCGSSVRFARRQCVRLVTEYTPASRAKSRALLCPLEISTIRAGSEILC
jgi:hypothetical protein